MKKNYVFFYLLIGVNLHSHSQSVPQNISQRDVDDAIQGSANFQFNYRGNWTHGTGTTDLYFNRTCSYSNVSSNDVTISFVGNDYRLTVSTAPHHGIMGVSVDNGAEVTYDLYDTEQRIKQISRLEPMEEGIHTIKIRVTGQKNPAATNTYVVIDFITLASGATNTAYGVNAFFYKVGHHNTAFGADALVGSPIIHGSGNTAVGSNALKKNWGSNNTALGYTALALNEGGSGNVAVGPSAMKSMINGIENTAIGASALSEYEHGWWNIGIGAFALERGSGNYNIAIGTNAGMGEHSGLEHTVAIGSWTTVTASNQVRIGSSHITSIGGQVSWSTLSDGRFKKDLKEDVSGLEFIRKLRPVSYTVDYDALDKFLRVPDSVRQQKVKSKMKPVRQTGFVAQEVEAVVKKVGYVFSGVELPKNENDHYNIRYAEFVVPLVKAMQELADKVESHEKIVEDQQKKIGLLVNQLKKYGVNTEDIIPTDEVELFQNNPNPFTLDTEIKMILPETALRAKIIVYNLEGKQLMDLPVQERGDVSIKIRAKELNEGMYLYALIVDGKIVDTKRMILTK